MFSLSRSLAGLSSRRVILGEEDHVHVWGRLASTCGFFRCRGRLCTCLAVCPGCLGSLEVGLQVGEGTPGLLLFWCPLHGGTD